tara:strand:+ start:408 stop:1334 length:927 start_codon:yes stop_codon:yes gene_type:complete
MEEYTASPTDMNDMVGLEKLKDDLDSWQSQQKQIPSALLFHGPVGTGKSTSAHLIGKALLGEHHDANFIETNGSDDRGINYVREELKQVMRTKPIGARMKVILLDEADGLTATAQDAMRRMMETYSSNNLLILTCNDISKIKPAIKSRCAVYGFPPVDAFHGANRLAKAYGLDDVAPLVKLIQLNNGDMRQSMIFLNSAGPDYENRINDLEASMDNSVQHVLADDWLNLRRSFHEQLRMGRGLQAILTNFYNNMQEHFDDEDNIDSMNDIMVAYGDVLVHRHTWVGNAYSYLDYLVAKMRKEVKMNDE